MFKEFFDEKTSASMVRLICFILVTTAVILSLTCSVLVILAKPITDLIYLIGVLLGFGLGAKVYQKDKEIKIGE